MADERTSTEDTRPEDEVVRLCQDLIGIDTSNYGDGSGPGERKAAEYVMTELTEVGLEPEIVESEPGRASVIVRVEGEDSERGALCVHGHLDVVPANADDWQVNPFGAEIKDDMIWGRGAVDMKDMDAMILACLRDLARTGKKPPRDIVFAFFADEEAGGVKGSGWLVDNRPELFEGVTEAISEVGGYSVTVPDAQGQQRRAYLLQTAEKGILWLRLTAHGRAGHGSVPNHENAVVRLAEAIARIDAHVWPRQYVASVRQLLDGLSDLTGVSYTEDDASALLEHLGGDDPVEAAVGERHVARVAVLHLPLPAGADLALELHRAEHGLHVGEVGLVAVERRHVGPAAQHLEAVPTLAAPDVEHGGARGDRELLEVDGDHALVSRGMAREALCSLTIRS